MRFGGDGHAWFQWGEALADGLGGTRCDTPSGHTRVDFAGGSTLKI